MDIPYPTFTGVSPPVPPIRSMFSAVIASTLLSLSPIYPSSSFFFFSSLLSICLSKLCGASGRVRCYILLTRCAKVH